MFGMLEAMYQLINTRLKGLYKWNVKTVNYTHPNNGFSDQLTNETDIFNVTAGSGWITYMRIEVTSDSTPCTVTWRLYVDGNGTPVAEDTLSPPSAGQYAKAEFMPVLVRYRNGFRLTAQQTAGTGTVTVYSPQVIALEDL
ncbi:hypothetical protein Desku_1101 [Desulfofundulus kuznetsovii DSM 6115]|uniref:Uncharacterized protein n=1 Tax=Desulfofundulus kuznetsovii (strain DSM 6115 / VKM B-1805 / 17) TaxID=760568 RepID=A0AAU8P9P8_DESK7|nr:hypothetical protein Desku_1101 [Desulfofundulus kuznetsovii DSM 6115]